MLHLQKKKTIKDFEFYILINFKNYIYIFFKDINY